MQQQRFSKGAEAGLYINRNPEFYGYDARPSEPRSVPQQIKTVTPVKPL